jgi:A/G-specific adenine glycosylase
MIPQKDVKKFQKEILSWYKKNKRDLSWRKSRDPYKILVSEIMLQQTQVSRVLPKYEAWLNAFPTVKELANAKMSEVLRVWSGLGYNRRALYLQKCAQTVIEKYGGKFPKTNEALKTLPGIGEYTAAAVSCFAYNQQVAVVDTNVRKVILIHFQKYVAKDTKQQMQTIAQELLPNGKAYEWNQALMDYSSATLKKEKIPVVKQTRFKGSNRYYRGQIIKLLLEKKEVKGEALTELFHKDEAFISRVVQGLEKDGMVKRKGRLITLH